MTSKQPLAKILQDYQQNWPDFDRPETRVMLGVIRLNDLVFESSKALIAEFGLTMAAFEALMTLRGQPEPWQMTPTALLQAILITSGGLTKVLGQLEQDGLIQRIDNPDDQRSRFVRLTPKGKTRAEASMQALATHDKDLLEQALNEQQITQLSKVLMRTVDKLEKHEERGEKSGSN
ncbi:DNA-binding transcriptional regulator, MarR family [Shimia gijangensis]|uniref:DNA-binding transcriptional regulator, MarR family n=1 Tax=Shimia gijangensis TaxID=1470563 RepID=A0A1M6KA53_9RHOB|nr:MarR family transcriptional regulator [Shimia gijangensis]SHJ55851.1 DNA-binding transcriptional regulator, MarR family [Shimia gijangensis]